MDTAQDLEIKGLEEIASTIDAKTEIPYQDTFAKNEIVHSDTNDYTNYLDSTEDSHDQSKNHETFVQQDNDEIFQCSQCNYQTRKKFHLRRHINSIHEGTKYPCDQCNYQASQDSNLKRHRRSAHP